LGEKPVNAYRRKTVIEKGGRILSCVFEKKKRAPQLKGIRDEERGNTSVWGLIPKIKRSYKKKNEGLGKFCWEKNCWEGG